MPTIKLTVNKFPNVKISEISLIIFLFGFYSCSPKPYSTTKKAYAKQSKSFAKKITATPLNLIAADSLKNPSFNAYTTNFGIRKPNIVVLHYTAQNSCEQTLQTFTKPATQVSAHYVICKDGTLYHMLNDYLRAWHAGVSKWGNNSDVNSNSIGIEIDNNGIDSFSTAQINTLLGVLAFVKKEYNIPAENFIGHSDVAPARKVDPGLLFPWKALSENGFGLWYGDTTGLTLPTNFNIKYALKIIGYDVKNLQNAVGAFKRHYLNAANDSLFTKPEEKVLYAVMQQYLN